MGDVFNVLMVVFVGLAVLLSVVLTILAFIFIIPEKKRAKLNRFGKFLHDAMNFKFLVVEKILQVTYVFLSIFVVLFGFAMLFYFQEVPHYSYYGGYSYTTEWFGYFGIPLILFGPIALRLVYEFVMMAILVVKNVIQINNKLKVAEEAPEKAVPPSPAPEPVQPKAEPQIEPVQPKAEPQPEPLQPKAESQQAQPEPAPQPSFCGHCGAQLKDGPFCPSCGKPR